MYLFFHYYESHCLFNPSAEALCVGEIVAIVICILIAVAIAVAMIVVLVIVIWRKMRKAGKYVFGI